MVHLLSDTSKAAALFGDWPETLITSCLQKIMGKIIRTHFNYLPVDGAQGGKFSRRCGANNDDRAEHQGPSQIRRMNRKACESP